jgi:tRNA(Ile)-lysidine synthase
MSTESRSTKKSIDYVMNTDVKYWIACSGGVDSTVLVHLFHQMGKSFGILHCNFQLRGEASEEDEAFVLNLAKVLNVPIQTKKFDTLVYKKDRKLNTQLAARELRYQWFNEIVLSGGAEICLAHHRDDQVETFLLQLRRGAKVRGLCAMPKSKDGFVRPLLSYTKSELIDLAKRNNWKWREDVSNRSNDYKRNLYRNELLPLLGQPIIDEIQRMTVGFQYVLGLLNDKVWWNENKYGAREVLIEDWECYPYWVKQYILANNGLSNFPVHEIDKLSLSKEVTQFSNGINEVWKWRDKLVFYVEHSFKQKIHIETVDHYKIKFKQGLLYLDANKVQGNLSIRSWEKDDKFRPLGMEGKKSVAKYLKDASVPPYVRKDLNVVTDTSNQIIGVPGFTIADEYKLTEPTSKIYVCSVEK